MQTVTIIFLNKAKAEAFMTWLSECGEQHYFEEVEENAVEHFAYNFDHKLIHATDNVEEGE